MIRWLWNQMMKWGWDFNRNLRGSGEIRVDDCIRGNAESNIRIGVMPAMNGKVLEIGKRNVHNNHGPDWNYTLFLVPDGMLLSDAVTTLLIAEGLNT